MKSFKFILLVVISLLYACEKSTEIDHRQTYQDAAKKERLRTIKTVNDNLYTKAVSIKEKTWFMGDTIKIKFLNGDSLIQEKVKQYAAIWLQYANLVFKYVALEEDADVKIGFDMDDRYLAWSTIGTDCKMIAQDEPSLNFVWLEDEEDSFIKAEVLRCFGHILGLGFEHRSPTSPIEFNGRAKVYFENTFGLSEDDIINEILPIYNKDQTNYSEYDKYSIMVLDIPRTILANPKDATTSNTELSENDKTYIASLYPFPEPHILVTMTTSAKFVTFRVEKIGDVTVDWGDGNREVNTFEHTYKDDLEHTIIFYGNKESLVKFNAGCTSLPESVPLNNQLITLDFSENRVLAEINCENNRLIQLDVSQNRALAYLFCGGNFLTHLDISQNKALKILNCISSNIDSLDVSSNIALVDLYCSNTLLKAIDVSKNLLLKNLWCEHTQIKKLDITHNPELLFLTLGETPLAEDFTKIISIVNNLPDRNGRTVGSVHIGFWRDDLEIRELCGLKNWDVWY